MHRSTNNDDPQIPKEGERSSSVKATKTTKTTATAATATATGTAALSTIAALTSTTAAVAVAAIGEENNNSMSDHVTSGADVVVDHTVAGASSSSSSSSAFNAMMFTGMTTMVLASTLGYLMIAKSSSNKKKNGSYGNISTKKQKKQEQRASIVDRTKYPGGIITVYYATQTGAAESFARQLEREGPTNGFLVKVVDVEDIGDSGNIQALINDISRQDDKTQRTRAIFLASTYGEGEPPDNAVTFAHMLKANSGIEILYEQEPIPQEVPSPDVLKDLDYCVFGLGNRQYDHFNAMGKFLDKSIGLLGAHRLLDVGLGDDEDDLDDDFETWKEKQLWPILKMKYITDVPPAAAAAEAVKRSSSTSTTIVPPPPPSQYVVEYHDHSTIHETSVTSATDSTLIHGSSKHYFTAVDCPVTCIKELRSPSDDGSTVHLEIDISKQKDKIQYETADNLGVLPMNDSEIVESVAKSLSLDLDSIFSIKAAPDTEWHGLPYPMPISIRECLTRYCDLTSPPRRSDLKVFASFARDTIDQKCLLRMSTPAGKDEYRDKILGHYVGIASLLNLCPSITMSFDQFLSICPTLQTRFFTISSSSSIYPTKIHITVAVDNQQIKPDGTLFKGVCSNYLANFMNINMNTNTNITASSKTVRVYNRPSSFRLPTDITRPIIMIGPGTGIAPMRALLQERQYQQKQQQEKNGNGAKKKVGKNILYFGCRYHNRDYIYKNELDEYQKDGTLNTLRVAFSREQQYNGPNINKQRLYVQHLLEEDSTDVWNLIHNDGAYVYVCGAAKMGQDVTECFKRIVMKKQNNDEQKAKEYITKLSHDGRLIQELWG